MRCLYNGIEHPEIIPYLDFLGRENCKECEYKYPCDCHPIDFSKDNLAILIDNIEVQLKFFKQKSSLLANP